MKSLKITINKIYTLPKIIIIKRIIVRKKKKEREIEIKTRIKTEKKGRNIRSIYPSIKRMQRLTRETLARFSRKEFNMASTPRWRINSISRPPPPRRNTREICLSAGNWLTKAKEAGRCFSRFAHQPRITNNPSFIELRVAVRSFGRRFTRRVLTQTD